MAKQQKSARKSATAASADSSRPSIRKTDWEAVERDYRTGRYSLRELEDKHGADNSLIARRAKRNGWTQDLSVAIRQATKAKLVKPESLVADATVVDIAAEVNKSIILEHRAAARRARQLSVSLLVELDTLEKEAKTPATLPARAKTLRSVAESLSKMVALEREAHDIGTAAEPPPPPPLAPGTSMDVDILAIRARIYQSLGMPPIEVQA